MTTTAGFPWSCNGTPELLPHISFHLAEPARSNAETASTHELLELHAGIRITLGVAIPSTHLGRI